MNTVEKEPGRLALPSPRTCKASTHPAGPVGSGCLGPKLSVPGKPVHLGAPVGCGLGERALFLESGFLPGEMPFRYMTSNRSLASSEPQLARQCRGGLVTVNRPSEAALGPKGMV